MLSLFFYLDRLFCVVQQRQRRSCGVDKRGSFFFFLCVCVRVCVMSGARKKELLNNSINKGKKAPTTRKSKNRSGKIKGT